MHFNGLQGKGQKIPREKKSFFYTHSYSAIKNQSCYTFGKGSEKVTERRQEINVTELVTDFIVRI